MEDLQPSQQFRPTELTVSKLRFYSAAIVAINKSLKSKDIEATPTEELPMLNGEITSASTDYKSNAVDASGAAYETSVKTSVTVKATWLSLSTSNRITAPDVRRGELVMLYQFGDADKYYWTTLKEDIALRKLETVIYAFSATQDESKPSDAQNTYYLEISTHKKLVHFHTSKADKEPFGYDIQINTKDGVITVTDDAGNFIFLNSIDRRIKLQNVDTSTVDIDKKNITISCPETITLKAKTILSQSDTDIVTTKTATINASNVAINGSSSIRVRSPGTTIN